MNADLVADAAEDRLLKGRSQGPERVPRSRRVAREVSDAHLEPVNDAVASTNVRDNTPGASATGTLSES